MSAFDRIPARIRKRLADLGDERICALACRFFALAAETQLRVDTFARTLKVGKLLVDQPPTDLQVALIQAEMLIALAELGGVSA